LFAKCSLNVKGANTPSYLSNWLLNISRNLQPGNAFSNSGIARTIAAAATLFT